jgi:type I restriction enzyme R subunit
MNLMFWLNKLNEITPTPSSVDSLGGDEVKIKEFVIIFREMTKNLIRLQTFNEFDFSDIKGITEQDYMDYKSKYLNVSRRVEKEKTSILQDIDFSLELMHTDKINVNYIINLIKNIDLLIKNNNKKILKKLKRN